jgi:Domain of unknown function (DUF4347)
LADATGAQVAAASDLVGSPALGGRWELDAGSSTPKARPPLTAEGIASYAGVMATKTWSGGGNANWSTAT